MLDSIQAANGGDMQRSPMAPGRGCQTPLFLSPLLQLLSTLTPSVPPHTPNQPHGALTGSPAPCASRRISQVSCGSIQANPAGVSVDNR